MTPPRGTETKSSRTPAAPSRAGVAAARTIAGMIGSHCSTAGGLYLAIEEAVALELDCVQIFTRSQRQWVAPPLTEETVRAWKAARTSAGWDDLPQRVVSHNSYLVNLAAPDETNRRKSIALQRDELERCEALGISFSVAHPGAHLCGSGGTPRAPRSPNLLRTPCSADEEEGLKTIARSLDTLHRELKGYRVITCLETTTGSGTNLGYDFAQLARIRALVQEPERVGFCLDTCHITSAGYDMSTERAARATLDEFDSICGKRSLFVIHINDSKSPGGSRIDRHEHIGLGTCGEACFAAVLRDPDLTLVPKILETAKEAHENGRPWDAVNSERLRSILSGPAKGADRDGPLARRARGTAAHGSAGRTTSRTKRGNGKDD